MAQGHDELRDWIKRRSFTQREAALYIGIDQTYLSAILNGRRQPGLTNAIEIERKTGITVESWLSSELDETIPAIAGTVDNLNHDKV